LALFYIHHMNRVNADSTINIVLVIIIIIITIIIIVLMQVWSREESLESFAAGDAEQYIAEGLGEFCDPLVAILDEFEQQLQHNKRRLLTGIEKMQKAYANYDRRRQIDHQFVL